MGRRGAWGAISDNTRHVYICSIIRTMRCYSLDQDFSFWKRRRRFCEMPGEQRPILILKKASLCIRTYNIRWVLINLSAGMTCKCEHDVVHVCRYAYYKRTTYIRTAIQRGQKYNIIRIRFLQMTRRRLILFAFFLSTLFGSGKSPTSSGIGRV